MSTTPTLIAGVAFSVGGAANTYLNLDDATRGLLDTGTLAEDTVFVDLTEYVHNASCKRGQQRISDLYTRAEAGTATVVFDNDNRGLDPTNLQGPYVSGGVTQVTPNRVIRLQAVWNGTTYDLWRGYADEWTIDYDKSLRRSTSTVDATDAIKPLANFDGGGVAAVGAGEDTGARISRVLDNMGWSDTDRLISTGKTTVQATTLAGNAWSEIQLVSDTELGELFVDGAGRVVFRDRHSILTRTRSNTSQHTFGDGPGELPFHKVQLSYTDDQVRNLVRITRAGGVQQTAQDAASQQLNLVRTFERNDLLMEDDSAAANYASHFVAQLKDAELRVVSMEVNLNNGGDQIAAVLGLEYGDRITVALTPPGAVADELTLEDGSTELTLEDGSTPLTLEGGATRIERDVFVRGIAYSISPEDWRATVYFQSATRFSFLTLDNATLGVLGDNALAY